MLMEGKLSSLMRDIVRGTPQTTVYDRRDLVGIGSPRLVGFAYLRYVRTNLSAC